jgi:hypothetical protein
VSASAGGFRCSSSVRSKINFAGGRLEWRIFLAFGCLLVGNGGVPPMAGLFESIL